MSELPQHPTPWQVEDHFRSLLREEGFAQPDEVEHDPEAAELVFLWREPKVAIVIELSEDGSLRMCARGVRPRRLSKGYW